MCVLRLCPVQGATVGSDDPGVTVIGNGNEIGHCAVIGARCQDLKYKHGDDCFLTIGDNNDIREHASIHRSSRPDHETRIGNGNMLMGSCHVAHDVVMGNHNIVGNNSLLAGHVHVGDNVRVSGACAVQPRVHLGAFCYLTGGSMVDRDVPPYTIVQGDRAAIRGLNEVLMSRCGLSLEEKRSIRLAYHALWDPSASDPACLQERAAQLLRQPSPPHARLLLQFVVDACIEGKKRNRVGGVCKIRQAAQHRGEDSFGLQHSVASIPAV
mmetsp:Transcript_6790/g.19067  ORF Transcript_6790/g.19067 Transcript_6790/m.19067 type:complete len:268 (+) Transcript_6790:709-1512(+)